MDFKDDDGRRHGDWQKKNLRKDANKIVGLEGEKPWYEQTFWVIVLILVFWPIGLFLCWKGDWPLPAKIAASAFVAFCIAGMLWVYLGTLA